MERVGRDPQRKLGWDDRLVGTLRMALHENIVPRRYALGTAAALATLQPAYLSAAIPATDLLSPLWGREAMLTKDAKDVLTLIEDAKSRLLHWRNSGFRELS